MATLAHKRAFQVFAVSDIISMNTSFIAAVYLIWANLGDIRLSLLALDLPVPSLGVALTTMSIAFTAGLFVAFQPVSTGLAILVLVLGGLFLVTNLAFFRPLYNPTLLNEE